MKNSSILIVALLAATALSSATSALAACPGTVGSGETVVGGCTLVGAGDAAIIQQGGAVVNAGGRGIYVGNTTVGGIDNSGTIEGSTQGIRQIGDSGIIHHITNNQTGVIRGGTGSAIDIDGGAIQNGIINNGRIEAAQTGIRIFKADIFANGIALGQTSNITGTRGVEIVAGGNPADGGTVTGDLVNNGAITVSEIGILLNSTTLTGDITNGASGTITVDTQHGIWLRNEAQNAVRARARNITNAGSIEAKHANGDGIKLEAADVTADVLNMGTIKAGGHGVRVGDASIVTGDLTNQNRVEAGSAAIYVGENSRVQSITNSASVTLISSASQGMLVKDSAVVNGITNNGTINAQSTGIYVQETVAVGAASADALTNTGGDHLGGA